MSTVKGRRRSSETQTDTHTHTHTHTLSHGVAHELRARQSVEAEREERFGTD